MSVGARNILRVPGRLAISCTDLNLAWPHGGTGLGAVMDVIFRRYSQDYPITIEEGGGEPVEYLQAGSVYGCVAFARGWDDDVLEAAFQANTGAVSGKSVIDIDSTVEAGTRLKSFAKTLVFTPEGSTHAKDPTKPDAKAPFWVLYSAIPMLDGAPDFALQRTAELGLPLLFMGLRDGSGRILSVGPRADVSVT